MAAFTDSLSRLPLGKRANADAARRLREEMGEMIDDVEMDVRDEDEEMKEWEEAQIRRAGGGGGGTGMGRDRGGRNNDAAGRKGPYRAAPSEFFPLTDTRLHKGPCTDVVSRPKVPQSSTLPSMSAVSARLSAALQALTASHTLEASALEHFEKERAELDSQETELRRVVVKTEEKSRWFGEFKDEVEDWSAFLDEKVRSQNLLI
jgi:GC-rich sequence DNA-binding factor